MKINKEIKQSFEFYPCELIYEQKLKIGISKVNNNEFGLITQLFTDLDSTDEIDKWASRIEKINYVKIDCSKLKAKEKVSYRNNWTVIVDEIFDNELIKSLNKENTVIYLENYCSCDLTIREALKDMVQNSRILDTNNIDLEKEQFIELIKPQLIIIQVDTSKIEQLNPIDSFEKYMLGCND